MTERERAELLDKARSLRAAAEDGRKLAEAYRRIADAKLAARLDRWRRTLAGRKDNPQAE